MVVQTKFPLQLNGRKLARDKKKASESTHSHEKRPQTKSPATELPTANVSLPLLAESVQPLFASSPKLRRAASVAAC